MIEDRIARCPIIFPSRLVPLEVFTVCKLLIPENLGPVTARSAGSIEQLYVEGVGDKSETLKIKSHRDDQDIINRYNYFHGIK